MIFQIDEMSKFNAFNNNQFNRGRDLSSPLALKINYELKIAFRTLN